MRWSVVMVLLFSLGLSGCDWLDKLLGRSRPQVSVPSLPPPPPPVRPVAPPSVPPVTAAPPPSPAAPKAPPVAPAKTPTAAPVAPVKPERPAGAKAVVIGDSHSAGAGYSKVLHAALESAYPGSVAYYGVCSANLAWWLAAPQSRNARMPCHAAAGPGKPAPRIESGAVPALPSIEDLLSVKPSLIIFALGSNPDADPGRLLGQVREKLASVPAGTRCLWVGPPPIPPRLDGYKKTFYEQLNAQLSSRCRILDSRTVMAGQPAGDASGVHYDEARARLWAQAVARMLE